MAETQDALLLKRRARRRLIGAIALVLLVVIVLPLILDREPRPVTQNLTVQIPSQDAGPFETRLPVREPIVLPRPVVLPKRDEAASASSVASSPPASATAQATGATGQVPAGAYIFSLGSYANADNARQMQDRAKTAGYRSFTEHIRAGGEQQTRVRAGPFASRDAAEKAWQKLKAQGVPVGPVAQQ